jgi:large subunit ribosomal protein L10
MRQEKHMLLDEVKGQIDQSSGSFVIIQYDKLKANKANDFRRQVREAGGDVEVMRKRILIKAASSAQIDLSLKDLPGHIALVYVAEDAIETTKLVIKFSQENDKTINVIGGRVDGLLYNAADMERLSQLPGRDEMRAQFLGLLEAPMAQTLAVMDAILSSVVYCLDNKVKEQSADEANESGASTDDESAAESTN